MRLLFCGTPQFAVPTLKHLLARPEFDVLGVISQPDRPRGRGQQISVSPVKDVALAAHLPVHQPEKIRAPEDRKSTRLNSSHGYISYAVFCLQKKTARRQRPITVSLRPLNRWQVQ